MALKRFSSFRWSHRKSAFLSLPSCLLTLVSCSRLFSKKLIYFFGCSMGWLLSYLEPIRFNILGRHAIYNIFIIVIRLLYIFHMAGFTYKPNNKMIYDIPIIYTITIGWLRKCNYQYYEYFLFQLHHSELTANALYIVL